MAASGRSHPDSGDDRRALADRAPARERPPRCNGCTRPHRADRHRPDRQAASASRSSSTGDADGRAALAGRQVPVATIRSRRETGVAARELPQRDQFYRELAAAISDREAALLLRGDRRARRRVRAAPRGHGAGRAGRPDRGLLARSRARRCCELVELHAPTWQDAIAARAATGSRSVRPSSARVARDVRADASRRSSRASRRVLAPDEREIIARVAESKGPPFAYPGRAVGARAHRLPARQPA